MHTWSPSAPPSAFRARSAHRCKQPAAQGLCKHASAASNPRQHILHQSVLTWPVRPSSNMIGPPKYPATIICMIIGPRCRQPAAEKKPADTGELDSSPSLARLVIPLAARALISSRCRHSLLYLLMQTSRPANSILGRLPETREYRNVKRFPMAKEIPGIRIFRFDSSLHFANKDYFENRLKALVSSRPLLLLLCLNVRMMADFCLGRHCISLEHAGRADGVTLVFFTSFFLCVGRLGAPERNNSKAFARPLTKPLQGTHSGINPNAPILPSLSQGSLYPSDDLSCPRDHILDFRLVDRSPYRHQPAQIWMKNHDEAYHSSHGTT